jgi:hypothetical protein
MLRLTLAAVTEPQARGTRQVGWRHPGRKRQVHLPVQARAIGVLESVA